MLATRVTEAAARGITRHGVMFTVVALRMMPRALSSKPPDKPVPTPEEEAERQAVQMKALETVLDAKNNTVSPPIYHQPLEPFPENPEEALALDPLPPSVAGRKVTISQKSRPATTSGLGGGLYAWHLTFKNQERWSNPLMGWTSSADPMSNMKLTFSTPEQAISFCKKRGWKWEVKAPNKQEAVYGKFAYAHNFLPHMVEHDLKVNGKNTEVFAFPTAGSSYYERPLNFHGTGTVRQHGNPEKK